ncbi:hypothetical protein AVEN_169961-1 [Araneus ventricosus]|uniref:Uncharacterized protein n=1 Tax=Araneus ventricosus TaxID=182803 RepID=A0A4Y2M281_ARAVE|nr:hypothetical protein AVEN_169961-1 [Araneus ventricosus]
MAVNRAHVKAGGSGQTASVHPFSRALPRYLLSHAAWEQRDCSEFHRPQSTSRATSTKRLRFAKLHSVGTRLKCSDSKGQRVDGRKPKHISYGLL